MVVIWQAVTSLQFFWRLLTEFVLFFAIFWQNLRLYRGMLIKFGFILWFFDKTCFHFVIVWRSLRFFCDLSTKFDVYVIFWQKLYLFFRPFDESCSSFAIFYSNLRCFRDLLITFPVILWFCAEICGFFFPFCNSLPKFALFYIRFSDWWTIFFLFIFRTECFKFSGNSEHNNLWYAVQLIVSRFSESHSMNLFMCSEIFVSPVVRECVIKMEINCMCFCKIFPDPRSSDWS